jgi:hypothetical protein
MPGAQRARSLACKIKKHTSIVPTVTPDTPGIPYAMVYGFLRALPGDRAFLSPSPAENSSTDLTPASRRQDHTTSPSASHASRQSVPASIASRPAFVTIAIRPCLGRDGAVVDLIWVRRERNYFCKQDWTASISLHPLNKLGLTREANSSGSSSKCALPRDDVNKLTPAVSSELRSRLDAAPETVAAPVFRRALPAAHQWRSRARR